MSHRVSKNPRAASVPLQPRRPMTRAGAQVQGLTGHPTVVFPVTSQVSRTDAGMKDLLTVRAEDTVRVPIYFKE